MVLSVFFCEQTHFGHGSRERAFVRVFADFQAALLRHLRPGFPANPESKYMVILRWAFLKVKGG